MKAGCLGGEMNHWEQRYQNGETGWDRGIVSPALSQWLEQGVLLRPGRILIPGCGRGHEVVELARLGFAVTAIDIAPSACMHLEQELAAARVSAEVVCGDLFEYKATSPFDVIYEQTCLCAITPEQRPAYENKLYDWLKPGGVLLALMMQTGHAGGPPFHCDLLSMHQLFSADRWLWQDNEPLFVPHKNGRFELGYVLTGQ